MNINQKAQELAKLIKTTDEFQTMNKYKREIVCRWYRAAFCRYDE